MRTRTMVASLAAVTMLSLLGACGGDDNDEGSPPADPAPTSEAPASETPASETPASEPPASEPAAEAVTITIEDFGYSDPGPVAPGTEITVENLDDASHTVTADSGEFDVTIKPGETVTFTAPSEPGDYPYVCTFHSGMTGTLVVQG